MKTLAEIIKITRKAAGLIKVCNNEDVKALLLLTERSLRNR